MTTTEGRVEIGPGCFYVVNPSTSYRKRWSSDATQLIVKFPRKPVDQLASAEGDALPVMFEQSTNRLPDPLDDLIKFLWRDLTTDGLKRHRPQREQTSDESRPALASQLGRRGVYTK